MEKFNLNFQTDKVLELWHILSDKGYLCFDKITNVKVSVKKQKRNEGMPFNSRARIETALYRIEDTLNYINTIPLGVDPQRMQAFDFYDFVNCEVVVIDCIEVLAHIFNLETEILELKAKKDIFRDSGTDNDFVKYIRSLASVHPLDTSGHPKYNGYENFHCSPRAYWDSTMQDGKDLTIAIYDSANTENELEYLRVSIDDFVKVLQRWINFIDVIAIAVKDYEKKSIEEYRLISMKNPDDFDDYVDYIKYLKEEYIKRGNDTQWNCFDDFIKIFSTNITNRENVGKVKLYKNAIMLSLAFLHKRTQNMEYEKGSSTGILYDSDTNYTELFIEVHNPINVGVNENDLKYCLEKLFIRRDDYRDRMDEIKGWVNQYVVFDNTESYDETYVLVTTALYLQSLEGQNVLNWNIPNDKKYRMKLFNVEKYDIQNSK